MKISWYLNVEGVSHARSKNTMLLYSLFGRIMLQGRITCITTHTEAAVDTKVSKKLCCFLEVKTIICWLLCCIWLVWTKDRNRNGKAWEFFFFVVFPILMSSAKKINFCNKSLRNGMFQLIWSDRILIIRYLFYWKVCPMLTVWLNWC